MANAPPVTSLTSSAQAFKYPLPTVRHFSKQLQVALDEKNARLRTLVGGSYRQLLGTAEMIVDMRRDIELAESNLARVADGCSRTAIGKKVTELGKLGLVRDVDPRGVVDLGWLAKMKAVDGCAIVVGRILRGKALDGKGKIQSRGARLVAAAKVLVLSRLLIKSLGEESENAERRPDDADKLLEDMKRTLTSLKRRLLNLLERMLVKTDGDGDNLVQALCAYSLSTSSGARAVLGYFLRVRGEAMALAFDGEEGPGNSVKEETILRVLALYTRTLLDVQALVPRQLSDALLSLKKNPLLKDDTIQGLEGLRLDLCERWFGDEILFFTPYIRHDELPGSQAVEMLKTWTKNASVILLQGLEKTLGYITEIKTIVDVRKKLYESWISEGGKAKGLDPSIMLDRLRKLVNNRLVNLVDARISKLRLVGTEITAVLNSFSSGLVKSQGNFWNRELLEMDLTGGAEDFKQAIITGVHGRDNSVSRVVKSHETWRGLVDEVFAIIEHLKNQRWNDNLESLEDDEVLESRSDFLSKEDPQMLQDHVDASLKKAYDDLNHAMEALLELHHNSEHYNRIAIFMLRVMRDIRNSLPKHENLKYFGIDMVDMLQRKLALEVSAGPISSFIESMTKQKRIIGRALWEGSPELPVQPSPTTFRFLHKLTSSMANAGNDLWSDTARGHLKEHSRQHLALEWSLILDPGFAVEYQLNGHRAGDEAETSAEPETSRVGDNQEILIQAIFDIDLLQMFLVSHNVGIRQDNLSNLGSYLADRIGLERSSTRQLHLSAQDYWKRTHLLFGLLS